MKARAMKPSGIPWVGDIPKDWEVTRLKYNVSTRESSGNFVAGRDKYIGLENVESNCGGYIETETEYSDALYDECKKGDILYSRLRPYLSKCLIAPFDGYCTGEFLNICRYDGDKRFLRYWLASSAVTNVINASTYGAKMPRADKKFILNMPFVFPPLPEQKRIAKYLDKATGRIDGLREKITKEIERLGEYKKSLIAEAVCGRVGSPREMKPSGIPWVGDIPKDWEVTKVGSCLKEVKDLNSSGSVTKALKFKYGTIIPKEDFDSDSDLYVANTILKYNVVIPGDIIVNGLNLNFDLKSYRTAMVKDKGVITSAYIAMRINEKNLFADYLNYLLKAYDFKKAFHNMGTGVRKILTFRELKKQPLVLPPLSEQKRIAKYLNKATEKIDALVEKRKVQLEKLDALKKSIVCEYVTGKKEVAA